MASVEMWLLKTIYKSQTEGLWVVHISLPTAASN